MEKMQSWLKLSRDRGWKKLSDVGLRVWFDLGISFLRTDASHYLEQAGFPMKSIFSMRTGLFHEVCSSL